MVNLASSERGSNSINLAYKADVDAEADAEAKVLMRMWMRMRMQKPRNVT